ncbi:MAG: hypothetical protein JJE47_06380 [Acidimicrobiia bacterium]|nr:hypothetical protein [Acidimicrobiia bacterium]
MEERGPVARDVVFRLVIAVTIIALASMHSPLLSHGPSAATVHASITSAHQTGSPCATRHPDSAALPTPTTSECPPNAEPIPSPPFQAGGLPHTSTQAILSIWRL